MAHGTWQQTGGGGSGKTVLAAVVALVLLGGGGAAAIAAFVTDVLEVLGAMVGFIFAVVVFFVVRAWRKGWRPSLVLAWQPPVALPARRVTPIAARRVEALPAPPVVNYSPLTVNNFYVTTPEQAAELAARRGIEGR